MTKRWFNCRIRYEKTAESGATKRVNEQYLVDALSFTEAEARITEEMRPFMSGEFQVTAIALASLAEVFSSDCADDTKWYKVRVAFITLDEKSGAERRTRQHMMVAADSTEHAERRLHECMKGTMADYAVEAVVETPVVDVFPYEPESETEETR